MRAALDEAQAAGTAGEVPVGAVVVCRGAVVGTGRNSPISTHDPTAHAEIAALRAAAAHLGNYRLEDCELFVTLEPCAMCAGAMLHARLKRVVFGAVDPKTGAGGSVLNLFANPQLNHQTQLQGGVLAHDCSVLLQDFFRQQRTQQRLEKLETGRALRDDALRTPDSCFDALPDMPEPSCYLSDMPSLAGLRLHYLDTGSEGASETWLCLHGRNDWSYVWRNQVRQASAQGQRMICPDLPGFGKSDKPKKAAFHTLQWHAQCLAELIVRLDLPAVTLLVPEDMQPLAQLVSMLMPQRVAHLRVHTPAALTAQARNAPFPDAGHRAAPRAFASMLGINKAAAGSSGPSS